ncbi:MAG TPA: hypothetical protein VID51_00845 [Solirubrobacterales bacterium]
MRSSDFGGQARWHNAFREWAAEELGDTRQVYARRADAPEEAPLVYMPDGEAHRLREAAKSGVLICPVPECPSKRLTTCAYREKRDHFRHVGPRPSHTHRRSYMQLTTHSMLRHWAADQDQVIELGEPEMDGDSFEIEGISLILVAHLDDGSEVALCYVDKRLGADAWEECHDFLRELGLVGAWIFSLTKTYFALPNQADPIADRNNLILDKPIYERMRKRGSWPLLLNLEEKEWANLLVPGGSRAENLGFSPPDLDHVVHVVPNRLADCRLCPYGIETPAINEWILRKSSHNKRS